MAYQDLPYEVVHLPLVDSTNRLALELARREGKKHGTVILADQQSGGRGRGSRSFSSPPGGLYISVILRPQLPVDDLPHITLATGNACADAIEQVTGIKIKLKWPNDLYAQGKKIGGILTEASAYSNITKSIPFVVAGIGVNLNTPLEFLPDSLHDNAASLYSFSGVTYEISALVEALIGTLLKEVDLLQDNKDNMVMRWQERDYLKGKSIIWQTPAGDNIRGTGKGLLPDGRYLLTTSGGDDYPVLAGDIAITEINGLKIK